MMEMDSKTYRKIHPIKYYKDYLEQNIRPDNREINDLRPVSINVGTIKTAEGSAVVKIGNTTSVCGIKAELAPPLATEPDKGFIIPNIDMSPLSSPKYRPGAPPSEDAQVTCRALADIIQNSNIIDLKDLCITKERLVWTLYCDIICLDSDGSVLDAALIALVSALHTVKLPVISYDKDTKICEINDNESLMPLKIKSIPVATSFAIFDKFIIADPTSLEENLGAAIVTVTVSNSSLSYVSKKGGVPLAPEKLEKCIQNSILREKSVCNLLKMALENK